MNNGFLELKATLDYNLGKLYPELAQQWHATKNKELTSLDVTPGSNRKIWWQCSRGHEWQARVYYRTIKSGNCPYCAGIYPTKDYNLAVKFPDLVREWHPTKNGKLTPYDLMPRSNKKVWWLCSQGHDWQAVISNRTQGSGCPYCSGQKASAEYNLAIKFPVLAKEWHPTKNDLTPYEVTPGSDLKVWWRCNKGQDHEWKTSIGGRSHGTGCPFCSGKKVGKDNNLGVLFPELVKQWHPTKNGNLTPFDVTPGSDRKVWWTCDKGHEWKTTVAHRKEGTNCPECYRRTKRERTKYRKREHLLQVNLHSFM